MPDVNARQFVALGRLACELDRSDYEDAVWLLFGIPKGSADQVYSKAKRGTTSRVGPMAVCRDETPSMADDKVMDALEPLAVACRNSSRTLSGRYPGGRY